MTDRNISLSQKEKSRFPYNYVILVASFFILLIVGGTISSFGVFLKPVLTEFGWSRAAISSVFSVNIVLGGLVGIIGGRFSDRFNPRLALIIGGLFMGLGYLMMSQVSAVWQIFLFYGILVSIGTGFIPIPVLSMLARWFVKGRGLACGIAMSGVGVGIVVVPPLANLFISLYDWRTSYLILGCITLFFTLFPAQFLRRAPGHGVVTDGDNARKTIESNLQSRGLPLGKALGTLTFWTLMIMGIIFFLGAQTIFVHIAAHATDIGFSSATAATIISVIGFINIGGTIGAGILGDKLGNKHAMIVVFILESVSYIGFRFSGQLWMLYLCAGVFGLGYGGFGAIQSPLIAEFFGLRDHGAILGLFILSQNIGGAIGPLVAGSIFDISGSYQWAFALCAILSIAGLVLSFIIKPAQGKI